MKSLISVIGVIAILAFVGVGSYVSNYNFGNRTENGIFTQHKSMKNELSQYSLKVMEAGQVPSMYKDDMKDVITSAMTAKFGEGGSKATFQWFKEQKIDLDPGMYKQIQQIIESGRNKFKNSQDKFFDQVNTYQIARGNLWQGMWLGFAGYPSAKYTKGDYDNFAVSSGHAKKAFDTGIDEGIKLR